MILTLKAICIVAYATLSTTHARCWIVGLPRGFRAEQVAALDEDLRQTAEQCFLQ